MHGKFVSAHARGLGHTSRMIAALPYEGAVIVCGHHDRRYIEPMISKARGPDVLKRCLVIAVEQERDVHRIKETEKPVFVDHAWRARPGTVELVAEAAGERLVWFGHPGEMRRIGDGSV